MQGNLGGALAALLAMAVFATHDVVVKTLGADLHPVQIVFFAALLGFPVMSLVLVNDSRARSLRPVHPGWIALRTACVIVTGVAAFQAFATLPLAQVYAILFTTPLLITLLAIPMLGERVGLHRGLAVLAGLLGVIVVLRPGATALSTGHAAALIAAGAGATGAIVTRKIGRVEESATMLLVPMLGNVVATGIALPFIYQPMQIGQIGLAAIVAILGLIGAFLSVRAYRMAEAAIVAPMQYSQMIWATIYGWFLFGESIDRYTLTGTAIIAASGLYIVLREGRSGISANRPVTRARMRPETPTAPRVSLLQRILPGRGQSS